MYHPSPERHAGGLGHQQRQERRAQAHEQPDEDARHRRGDRDAEDEVPRPAPSVRATSRYDARMLETPDAVSIVTGNQTASAISADARDVGLREEDQGQRDPRGGGDRPDDLQDRHSPVARRGGPADR